MFAEGLNMMWYSDVICVKYYEIIKGEMLTRWHASGREFDSNVT